MSSPAPWSFSRIKAFKTCPRQFHEMKVLKLHPQEETQAMLYGTQFHEAAEFYIRDGTELPKRFEYARPALDALNRKRGDKLCEYELGLTADLEPCGFKDDNVWFRGIVDLLIIDGDLAWVIDHKTGRNARYADKGQLELMALAVFKHFPTIQRINAGLLFVVAGELIKARYHRHQEADMWQKWLTEYGTMEKAYQTDVWNPKPSGLCRKHCPVVSCPHNGANS